MPASNFENMINSLDLLLESDITEENKEYFYNILTNLIHHKIFTEDSEQYVLSGINTINELLDQ